MPFTHSGQVIANLDGVPDVVITSPVNGQMLVYNSATGKWENGTPAGGGDMLKSLYDTDNDGKVDTSNDVSDAPLITTTSVASAGGLLINIDSATGDIARTTDGWIEDEKYGIRFDSVATSASGEFDSAVTRTGRLTLKLSTTDATGTCLVAFGNTASMAVPIKPSTKYKLSVWVKTNNVATNSIYFAATEYTSAYVVIGGTFTNWTSSKVSGTNDWTLITKTVTTNASAAYLHPLLYNGVAGNISDAWFDINSMTLEEVVEPVANSLTSSSPSLVSFTAVGSTDNIDQSQLTNTANVSFLNTAQYQAQQFTPTKSKFTGVILSKVASTGSPTGDMVFKIATDSADSPTSTILASYTMPSATYNALGATEFTVNLPCNLTAGTKYWLLVNYSISSATDYTRLGAVTPSSYTGGLFKYGTDGVTYGTTYNGDFYFKTLYYKPTTNFKASQNNSTVSISADEDGFLDGSVINLTTGSYSVTKTFFNNLPGLVSSDILSYDLTGGSGLTTSAVYEIPIATTFGVNNAVWKIQNSLPISSINITNTVNVPATRSFKLQYSTDNVTYVDLETFTVSGVTSSTIPLSSVTEFYIRYVAVNNICYLRAFTISATIDTSSLPTLRNYPTNKDVITTYNKSLASATTSATYRATKWGLPAIEYSATEYQYLDIDTTATSSVVKFSQDGVTYSTVADGASLTITSTTTPLLWVKTNITANRIYLSSNNYNASSSKGGSNKMTVGYQVLSQGLGYDVLDMKDEIEALRLAVYALQNP